MQQHQFSSELFDFRNASRLKSGHSATEREWEWGGRHVNVNSLRPSELIESGRRVKRSKVKGRLWGDRLQCLDKDTVSWDPLPVSAYGSKFAFRVRPCSFQTHLAVWQVLAHAPVRMVCDGVCRLSPQSKTSPCIYSVHFSRKHWRAWNGLIWLRRTSGGILWARYWNFGFHKMWEIYWLTTELSACQKGRCYM